MTEPTRPRPLDASFAATLGNRKADVVTGPEDNVEIRQHGAATIAMTGWPGWPAGLQSEEPIIETYVAGADGVTATSDNQPFVQAWEPLIEWLNTTVRSELDRYRLEIDGDAYATASLTATSLLEGTAHMDDDTFVPSDSAQIVAIVGELAGPRVATGALSAGPLRPMSQLQWSDEQLADFERDALPHCAGPPDQLVIFAQFGQLHAGPAAEHVAALATHRQLLVYRAALVVDS